MKEFYLWLLLVSFLWGGTAFSQTYVSTLQLGSSGNDEAVAVRVDSDGNYYVTGYFSGTTDFDTGPRTATLTAAGAGDIFLAKYTSSNMLVWVKHIKGTSVLSAEVPTSMTLTSTDIYLAGYFYDAVDFDAGAPGDTLSANGNFDGFLARYDLAGNLIWAKNIGGVDRDVVNDIAADANGDLYVTGYFFGTADFDPGSGSLLLSANSLAADAFVAKYNGNGDVIWAKGFGGSFSDIGWAVRSDDAGNVLTAGHFTDSTDFDPGVGVHKIYSNGSQDGFVLKLDGAGNFIWAANMGGSMDDMATSLVIDDSGNILTQGNFTGSGDFDPGPGTFTLPDGHVFITRLNSSGGLLWARAFTGAGAYNGNGENDIALGTSGNIYLTGSFTDTVDVDPGAGESILASLGLQDIYFAELDADGNFVCSGRFGGAGSDRTSWIEVSPAGDMFIPGKFSQSVDFDPGTGEQFYNAAGDFDAFVNVLNSCGSFVQIEERNIMNRPFIYPNPNDGRFVIELQSGISEVSRMIIYDVSGKEVYSTNINYESGVIMIDDLAGIKKGIYSVMVVDGGVRKCIGKVLVQE